MRLWRCVLVALHTLLAAQTPPPPSEAPENWLLSFIDVETTGLVPGHHEMIDMGIVLADLDGADVSRLHLRIMPEYPERTSPGAVAVNGFDVDKWRSYDALGAQAAVDSMTAFYGRHTGGRSVLMVAFNSPFDAAFLDHLFRSVGDSWRNLHHYFILDIPSMAWSLGLRGLTGISLAGELGIADEPHSPDEHTGITGADLNWRVYRALMNYKPSD